MLTAEDVSSKTSRHHIENTLEALMKMGIIPIVNENDTVSIAELQESGEGFGDNDTLSAIVAELVNADVLVMVTDIDGLYNGDPRTDPDVKRIPYVETITPEIEALAGAPGSSRGTGGMATKVRAAKFANEQGITCCVMSGARPKDLYILFDGGQIGTVFQGKR